MTNKKDLRERCCKDLKMVLIEPTPAFTCGNTKTPNSSANEVIPH
jgi:hypothetical protein